MPARVLLLSCYELERPPLSLAWPLAFLREAGIEADAADLWLEPFPEQRVAAARLVAIAVPMHTALRLSVEVAARVRRLQPEAHIALVGQYAWLNAEFLLDGLADSVLAGEAEPALVALAQALLGGSSGEGLAGVRTRRSSAAAPLSRPRYPVPDRRGLPGLDRYARFLRDGRPVAAGYAEASRGCLHHCRHCPVVPIYGGRFVAVPVDVVMQDVANQVEAGARHISFGDPDFLNGPGHALRVARALHAAFPDVSFDFTAKVEHVVEHAALFPELAGLGCAFVVSAVESLSETVLERLAKGHTAADVETAVQTLHAAGITLHATLIPFTPWASLDDYLGLLEFFAQRRDRVHVPPVQLSLRLLVPPGSALLAEPESRSWLGPLDPGNFVHRWVHPDPRMDRLQQDVAALVEEAAARHEAEDLTWQGVRSLAWRSTGNAGPLEVTRSARRCEPPRLTAHWFC